MSPSLAYPLPLPLPLDCNIANTSDSCTETVQGASLLHVISLPLFSSPDKKFSDDDISASNNYHDRLLPNVIAGNNTVTTTPFRTPEEGHGVGLESECKNNDETSTEYIACPPSKVPAQQPKIQQWWKIMTRCNWIKDTTVITISLILTKFWHRRWPQQVLQRSHPVIRLISMIKYFNKFCRGKHFGKNGMTDVEAKTLNIN